jgi:hypothetical protein
MMAQHVQRDAPCAQTLHCIVTPIKLTNCSPLKHAINMRLASSRHQTTLSEKLHLYLFPPVLLRRNNRHDSNDCDGMMQRPTNPRSAIRNTSLHCLPLLDHIADSIKPVLLLQ